MAKKQQKKKKKRNGSGSFWLGFLKFLGFFVLCGLLLLYWDSARLTKIISNAHPVLELTPDIDEIVRLDGSVEGIAAVTDEGKLRNTYALLQKETFLWGCSKSNCDYKRSEDRRPEVSGSFVINGVVVQADWFRFYTNWSPWILAPLIRVNCLIYMKERHPGRCWWRVRRKGHMATMQCPQGNKSRSSDAPKRADWSRSPCPARKSTT